MGIEKDLLSEIIDTDVNLSYAIKERQNTNGDTHLRTIYFFY
jgi:hypothetical protein